MNINNRSLDIYVRLLRIRNQSAEGEKKTNGQQKMGRGLFSIPNLMTADLPDRQTDREEEEESLEQNSEGQFGSRVENFDPSE